MKGRLLAVIGILAVIVVISLPSTSSTQAGGYVSVNVSHRPFQPIPGQPVTIAASLDQPNIRAIEIHLVSLQTFGELRIGDPPIIRRCASQNTSITGCSSTHYFGNAGAGEYLYYAIAQDVSGLTFASPVYRMMVLATKPTGTGIIGGLLWDLKTAKPVGGTHYTVVRWGYEHVYLTGKTGTDGSFFEENLPSGSYMIYLRTNDYVNLIRVDHSGGSEGVWTCECPNGMFEMAIGPIKIEDGQKKNIWLGLYGHPWEPGVVLPPRGLG